MKKIILTLFFIGTTIASFGQNSSFGIKAGANLSSITGDDTDGLDSRFSYHLGGFAEFRLNDTFAIQPELLLSSEGAKVSAEGVDVSFIYTYLQVPIIGKYYLSDQFSLDVGPQIGINISAKVKADSEDADIEDVSTLALGASIGTSYSFTDNISVSARYNIGFSNIYSGEGSDDFKQKINTLQISLNYKF